MPSRETMVKPPAKRTSLSVYIARIVLLNSTVLSMAAVRADIEDDDRND